MTTHGPSVLRRAFRKANRITTRARDRFRGLPLRKAEIQQGRPIPPGRLIYLVANTEDVSWYLETGALAARSIREILSKNGLAIEGFARILDFGCGVARVIRQWQDLRGPQLFGTDYNPRLIDWCQANLTYANFNTNSLDQPLDKADGSFDFIYCLSVFTHLSEPLQQFWMDELFRVLSPGGYLLITTHGDHYLPMLTIEEQKNYREGHAVVQKTNREGSNDCAAFHPVSFVKESLAKKYEVIDFLPEGALGNPSQDLYLLRRPLESSPCTVAMKST